MILSGGVAFIWVDPSQGGGWTWPEVYRFMAWLMVAAAVVSAVLLRAEASAIRAFEDAVDAIEEVVEARRMIGEADLMRGLLVLGERAETRALVDAVRHARFDVE